VNAPVHGSFEIVAFSASEFLDDLSRYIVTAHRDALPNLTDLTLLIAPRGAPALRAAIARAAHARGAKALMLPCITTLRDWAAEADVPNSKMASDAERVLDVFAVLKKQKLFSAGETLALSHELVRLGDELTDQLVTLPKSLDEHARALARAYGIAKQNSHFSFEAQLTYEVWRTLADVGSQTQGQSIDRATRYGLQLAKLVESARGPLYVVGLAGYTRRELAFFSAYAKTAKVTQFVSPLQPSESADKFTNGFTNSRELFFANAWAGAPGGPTHSFAAAADVPPIECFSARDVEDEASAALNIIKSWLVAGKRSIAVVAFDRRAARRLRALAERDAILMADEIGWPYSTTLSATAVIRWLEAKRDGFYYQTLLDLLKSPFIFADLLLGSSTDWSRDRLSRAVLLIERAIHREMVVSGLLRVREALVRHTLDSDAGATTNTNAEDSFALLDRLIAADRAFATTRRPATAWIETLAATLVTLGLDQGLQRDTAGVGLLQLLAQTKEDVASSTINLSMSEWTDWLRMRLEESRFRDATIDSSIVITSLDATRFRTFDAALLLGAATTNLSGTATTAGVFNQSVRRTLNLPTQAERSVEITQDLFGLLCRSTSVWISWQGQHPREPQLAAPWVSALLLAAKQRDVNLFAKSAVALSHGYGPARTPLSVRSSGHMLSSPAPIVEFEQVPRKITASGYQQLIDCPYQYFAQSILKLREADELTEEMEKRDFGEMVHDILNRFHQKIPDVSTVPLDDAKAALLAETAIVFANALAQNFIAHAWRLQWESAIDAYLVWQTKREAEGWRWQAGELKSCFDLPLDNGEILRVEGRIDRLDLNDEHTGVIDYKARNANALKTKLNCAGEDVQLAVYAALAEGLHPERAVTDAAYLAIEKADVKKIGYPDPETAGAENMQRLHIMFDAIYAGARLPAQGADAVCERCAVRGLCRKDYWPEVAEDIVVEDKPDA
jgi:ATP-dependent helicase/nuclease subunit B